MAIKTTEIFIGAGFLLLLYIFFSDTVWDDVFLLVILLIVTALVFMVSGGVTGLIG